jgi:hypothetical protein
MTDLGTDINRKQQQYHVNSQKSPFVYRFGGAHGAFSIVYALRLE